MGMFNGKKVVGVVLGPQQHLYIHHSTLEIVWNEDGERRSIRAGIQVPKPNNTALTPADIETYGCLISNCYYESTELATSRAGKMPNPEFYITITNGEIVGFYTRGFLDFDSSINLFEYYYDKSESTITLTVSLDNYEVHQIY